MGGVPRVASNSQNSSLNRGEEGSAEIEILGTLETNKSRQFRELRRTSPNVCRIGSVNDALGLFSELAGVRSGIWSLGGILLNP